MKTYISRIRQDDGSWTVDPVPRSLIETKRLDKINRGLAGIVTQIWPLHEAEVSLADELRTARDKAGIEV